MNDPEIELFEAQVDQLCRTFLDYADRVASVSSGFHMAQEQAQQLGMGDIYEYAYTTVVGLTLTGVGRPSDQVARRFGAAMKGMVRGGWISLIEGVWVWSDAADVLRLTDSVEFDRIAVLDPMWQALDGWS